MTLNFLFAFAVWMVNMTIDIKFTVTVAKFTVTLTYTTATFLYEFRQCRVWK